MSSNQQPEEKGKKSKLTATIALSGIFLVAAIGTGLLINHLNHQSVQLKENLDNPNKHLEQQKETLIEVGKKILDQHCVDAFKRAIQAGDVSAPVTKQSLLAANVSFVLPYSDENPAAKMAEWAESHGPEYKVTNGKLDCSYLVRRQEASTP